MPSSDCHFSPSCEKFIHVSSDSRIHVYDVLGGSSKKKTLVDRNHLAHSYTCIAWGNTPSTRSIVAVGFSDGLVFIWDMSRGVIVQTLGVVNQSPAPTDVVFGSDDSSIFVSAQGHPVIQYNRLTGEVVQQMKVGRKGAAKLALNPKANVLVACRYVFPI